MVDDPHHDPTSFLYDGTWWTACDDLACPRRHDVDPDGIRRHLMVPADAKGSRPNS